MMTINSAPLNYKGGQLCSNVKTLSLDWLSLHVKIPLNIIQDENGKPIYETENFTLSRSANYEVEKIEATSFHFKHIYKVFQLQGSEQIEFATIECLPHVSFIPANTAIIKIHNRILYSNQYHEITKQLLNEFNFTFVNYSRIDFAMDFNSFLGGLSPIDFINRIANNTFVFRGRKNQRFIASEGYELHRNGKHFNALKLGSRKSDLTIQLYNKTLEQQKKASKPWIKEFWQQNKLYETQNPVWRLEISMKKSDKSLIDLETGEAIADWQNIDLITPENVVKIFSILYNQHFQVALSVEGKTQFCRLPKLKLLNIPTVLNLLQRINDKIPSTSWVKYRVKKLVESVSEYKTEYIERAKELANHVIDILSQHDLKDWFSNKYGNIHNYYYVE